MALVTTSIPSKTAAVKDPLDKTSFPNRPNWVLTNRPIHGIMVLTDTKNETQMALEIFTKATIALEHFSPDEIIEIAIFIIEHLLAH